MSPSPAPIIDTIKVNALCESAARVGRFSREEARLALGAVSNMYCLYALQSSTADVTTTMHAFASDPIANRRAVLVEIQRAVPRADAKLAEAILGALTCSLDRVFLTEHYRQALLPGFGVLEPIDLARSEYRLTVELPLARFLRSAA